MMQIARYLHGVKQLLQKAALWGLLTLLLSFSCSRQSDRQPDAVSPLKPENLLFITMDTTRADHLGCYGYSGGTSPNLDKLAARGLRFNQAMTPVALTRPSHASLFTGLLPHRHGIWSNGPYRLDPQKTTLAEQFSGFRTGAVVSSFVLTSSFGLNQGFQFFEDHLQEKPGEDPERSAADAARVASTWLEQADQRPFFLWVHFYDPHYPYDPPEPLKTRFAKQPYDGEIASMDQSIGDIIRLLERKGLLKETLVVAVGDHGEGLGEHGEETHGYFLYDSTVRVPLILAGPGIPEGKSTNRTISTIDLAPTLLEAFGVRSEAMEFDGKSFWAHVQDQNFLPETVFLENRSIHYQFGWARISGIRTDAWKYLDSPVPELYDMQKDPGETRNLAMTQSARVEELKRMWQKLRPAPETQKPAGLTPEEEEKLASLGYISAGSESDQSDEASGPDAKQFARLTLMIEDVIRKRQRNQILETEPDLSAILAADPSNRFALRAQGELLLQQQRYPQALQVLKKLTDSYENHPETLAFLATAYEKTGDTIHAIEFYKKAIQPPWIYWPALESMARLSVRAPGSVSGSELVAQMRALNSQSYRETISLARAFAILGQWNDAQTMYRKALEQQPGGVEATVGFAQMLIKQGHNTEAIELLRKVNPPTVESLYVLGTALQALGSPEACSVLAECARKHPTNPNLVAGLSRALQQCN